MEKILSIKKNHEFQRLYRRGTSAVGGCLVIYCRKNRLRRNRVGLTASTKLGNAVQRNRARRRMREMYRLNADRLSPGWDLILVARTSTCRVAWAELNDTFFRLCKKLGLLRDTPTGHEKAYGGLSARQGKAYSEPPVSQKAYSEPPTGQGKGRGS